MCALYWSLLWLPCWPALAWAAFWDTAWAGTQSNPHAPMPLKLLPKAPVLRFKQPENLQRPSKSALSLPPNHAADVLPLHKR